MFFLYIGSVQVAGPFFSLEEAYNARNDFRYAGRVWIGGPNECRV